MKPAPAPAFVVVQADFIFEFVEVSFNAPADLRQPDQVGKRGVGWERGKPVAGGFGLLMRPFNQQQFRRARDDP